MDLQAYSADRTLVLSATAFAGQTDGDPINNTAFAEVSENNLNVGPTLASVVPDITATENDSVSIPLSGNFQDTDGDSLAFTASGLPASLSINTASGLITGTLTAADVQSNAYSVMVTATDPFGDVAQGSFGLTVWRLNR